MEQELVQKGFGGNQACSNLYGLVAYGGGSSQSDNSRILLSLEGTAMSNWTNFLQVLGNIDTHSVTPGRADGYAAMTYALDRLPLRMGCPSVNKIMIHLSTRSREVVDASSGKDLLRLRFQFENVILHTVTEADFRAGGQSAFGVFRPSSSSVLLGGYTPSQSGFYRQVNASATIETSPGTITEDYIDLALAAGGGAFDISRTIRKAVGLSLAVAMVDNSLSTIQEVANYINATLFQTKFIKEVRFSGAV